MIVKIDTEKLTIEIQGDVNIKDLHSIIQSLSNGNDYKISTGVDLSLLWKPTNPFPPQDATKIWRDYTGTAPSNYPTFTSSSSNDIKR